MKRHRAGEHNGQAQTHLLHTEDLDIFFFIGFRDGAKLSACCSSFRYGLSRPRSLEVQLQMMSELVLSLDWLSLEVCLVRLSLAIPSFVEATVGTYCAALHALGVIPRLGVEIVEAFQFYLRSTQFFYCSNCVKVWTSYVMGSEQHNGFEDFAAAAVPDDELSRKVRFLHLLQELVQCAVGALPACQCARQ